jgi:hypothetical protein
MELRDIPTLAEWMRQHVPFVITLVLLGVIGYGAIMFTGSYASKFGEAYVGSYTKFKKTVATYTVIDAMLNDFLSQFNANRISIARFHNSVHDVGNNSLFFVSVETIITSPGVSANQEEVANLPASAFAQLLPEMVSQHAVWIETKDLRNGTLKDITMRRGTKVGLFVPINDLSNQVIGMLHVSWLSDHDIPNEPERSKLIKSLQDAANRIGGYYSAVNK